MKAPTLAKAALLMRKTARIFLSIVMLAAISAGAHAGQYARWAGGALQIRGYDTTAYFEVGKPATGTQSNVVKWKGGTWRFGSAKEAALFRANPTAYAPQFGAYCTGGLSQHHVVNGHPKNWRIHNGRLYLFYAAAGARRFDKNPDEVIRAARAYAKKVGIIER
jgi:YHS domain-containing protein